MHFSACLFWLHWPSWSLPTFVGMQTPSVLVGSMDIEEDLLEELVK
jgi:hypothetical protein